MNEQFLTRAKRVGGSLAVIIPASYVDILEIQEEQVLRVQVQKEGGYLGKATSDAHN